MENLTINACMKCEDPLAPECLEFLANYHEENLLIDYKAEFNFKEDREWLEITKDVMAFANTDGGYLLFGIKNVTYDPVGLDPDTKNCLLDINNFQQGINKHVDLPVRSIRSKEFRYKDLDLVAMYIPRTPRTTHVVSKDGVFRSAKGGQDKVWIHKGMIYFRHVGGNHVASNRDIDDLVERRLQEFKHSLLNNITRVIEAPPSNSVLVVSSDPSDKSGTKFKVENGPDAISVKGLTLAMVPETTEQEIAVWLSIRERTPETQPPSHLLWQWYAQREDLKLTKEQKLAVARYCLISGVPVFYWFQGSAAAAIGSVITDAFNSKVSGATETIMKVAAFLGKGFHGTLARRFRDSNQRFNYHFLKFPASGARSLFNEDLIQGILKHNCKDVEENCSVYVLKELNVISSSVDGHKVKEPDMQQRWQAEAYDCYLYAQDDKYQQAGVQQQDEHPKGETEPS